MEVRKMSDSKKSTNQMPTEFSTRKVETRSVHNKTYKKPTADRSMPTIPPADKKS